MKSAEEFHEEYIKARHIVVPTDFIRRVQADALKHSADTVLLLMNHDETVGFNAAAIFDSLFTEALALDPNLAAKYQNKQ